MATFTVRTPIQVRFSDTDMLGHINNACIATWSEIGRMDFFGELGLRGPSMILARLAVDFRAQIRLGQEILVTSSVERVGTSSFTMRQRVLADGQCAADIEAVVVHFDYAEQAAAPLPDEITEKLVEGPGELLLTDEEQ